MGLGRKRSCLLGWMPEAANKDGYGAHPPDGLGRRLYCGKGNEGKEG